jgi:hypothetical protein
MAIKREHYNLMTFQNAGELNTPYTATHNCHCKQDKVKRGGRTLMAVCTIFNQPLSFIRSHCVTHTLNSS